MLIAEKASITVPDVVLKLINCEAVDSQAKTRWTHTSTASQRTRRQGEEDLLGRRGMVGRRLEREREDVCCARMSRGTHDHADVADWRGGRITIVDGDERGRREAPWWRHSAGFCRTMSE